MLMASQGPGECLEHWIRTSGYYCGQLKGTFGGGEKNFLKREFSVTQPTERLCSSLLVVAGAASLISEKQATTPGTQTACHGQAAQVVGAPDSQRSVQEDSPSEALLKLLQSGIL